MKVKIKTTQEIENEIDVQFPFYTKRDNAFYKVIDQGLAVRVLTGYFQEIAQTQMSYALTDGFVFIDEVDFLKELNQAKKLLKI